MFVAVDGKYFAAHIDFLLILSALPRKNLRYGEREREREIEKPIPFLDPLSLSNDTS